MINNKIRYYLIIFLVSFFFGCSTITSKTISPPYVLEAHEQYYFALRHFRHEQYEEALKQSYKVIENYPKSEAAHKAQFLIVDTLLKLNRKEEALEGFKAIIKLYPKSFEIYEKMGDLHKESEDFEAAVVAYKEAFKLAMEKKSLKTSDIKFKLIKLERTLARQNLRNARKIKRVSPEDYHKYSKYFKRAAELYKDIIYYEDKTDSYHYHDLFYRLGESYVGFKKYKKAEQAYEEYKKWAMASNETGYIDVAFHGLVWAYLGSEKFAKLIDSYLEAQETIFPTRDLVWPMIGFARDEKKLSKLLLALEKASKYDKNNPFLIYALSVGYDLSGNKDKAIIFCKKALELRPHTEDFYSYLGLLHWKNKMYYEAITYYEKAKAISPQKFFYYRFIALIYLNRIEEMKEKEKAIAIIKEGIKNCSDDPNLIEEVKDIYYRCQRYGFYDRDIEDILVKDFETNR